MVNRQSFSNRHIGAGAEQVEQMLKALGFSTLEQLIQQTIPEGIRSPKPLALPEAKEEMAALKELKAIAAQNQVYRTHIGMGYYDCHTPPVIQRNILENPGWYTAYTPYQAEIAQGRLEALLNFQTMVIDLTAMEIANASLLDEGTAAAEAMTMSYSLTKTTNNKSFFMSQECHPQTIAVVRTRALPLGIEVIIGDHNTFDFTQPIFGALLQYPATDGTIYDYGRFIEAAHQHQALVTLATDILSLTLLTPPGELGADVAIGSTQRLGVPLGYGGPHAAYFATKETYARQIPGRIVGVSKDVQGNPALRLALQTREQHIRRDKATSNICTAQVLLAVIASMYAVYHGPQGLKEIASTIHGHTCYLAQLLQEAGYQVNSQPFFDTLRVDTPEAASIVAKALDKGINLRLLHSQAVCISLDETTTIEHIQELGEIFGVVKDFQDTSTSCIPDHLTRVSKYLSSSVFNIYHCETDFLRYVHRLEAKDLALNTSMIPLGSCTMKLNATAEMIPITWPEFNSIHPFAPLPQAQGYQTLFQQLESWLAEITGFDAISLQPNAGSQGEYAGLQVIRKYHQAQGEGSRHVCLIPESAHGTNPASAVMCGMKVVPVKCDSQGNINIEDLRQKALKHQGELAALMVTYPSTHGVFEEGIGEICAIIHRYGGQVYMDGANMNAQVGLCRPGDFGADVCHLNLHKTFCIPHGGGGPGVGPIGVKAHLSPFLPDAQGLLTGKLDDSSVGAISAAPWGSASILPISWMYIRMMGGEGLTRATQVAILNANYIADRLQHHYPILYKGKQGLVAHECIIDLRPLKKRAHIEVQDVAKRLMDYGFHAPTVSWPVAGTMMIEPTESESKEELDRFCDAMISIRQEVEAIEEGRMHLVDNPLRNSPHTAQMVVSSEWTHPYSRESAAYPAPWTKEHKFWPVVARIDNAYGDRNLICSCEGMDSYQEQK